ncbi:hypothetical protein [Alkalihalobacillus deserti]|uniref:hypothetical protein n=1 Tax=Alkalihalobacillus deserti TaxID=2879466 RepID=UPI001D150E3F|nr:hypothetical protein [Alkalihalobacillus deserti]
MFIIDFGLAVFGEMNEVAVSTTDASEKTLFKERSYKSDFYALGHFLLFLLYSQFHPTSQKEQSWEDELVIKAETRDIIRKLLRIKGSFNHIDEIFLDVETVIKTL